MTAPPDRPPELAAKVAAAIERLGRSQRTRRQGIAAGRGLTPLQVDLLRTLAAGEPPQPVVGLLAIELGVTQPTVTESLRALERKGFVTRGSDPGDARRTAVVLTDTGRELAGELDATTDELVHAIAALGADRQAEMLEGLLTIIAELVERGAITVARTCLTCRFHELTASAHRCTLLDMDLQRADLRVNCPEHALATA